MAKAHKLAAQLRKTAVKNFEALYDKHASKFFDALEDNEKKRLNLNIVHTFDLGESAPVVSTSIMFKDKTTEGGMDVVKTFRAGNAVQEDDPDQTQLPGTTADDLEKGKGKK